MQQENGIEKPRRKRATKDPYARRRIPKPDGGYTISVPPGYYTSEEAQKKLRMNRRTFFNHVKDGSIPHEKIPMMSHNMYPKKEIDAIADMHIIYMLTKQMLEEESSAFRVATVDDIAGISNVLIKLWGSAPDEKLRASWYAKNPQLDYVVLQHGIVMGFISATPYTEAALEDRMSGKRSSSAILASDIVPFVPGQTYDLFIGMVMRPDVKQHQKQYAARLLIGFFHELAGLIRRGIGIRRFYACSDQPDGENFCEKMGFTRSERQPGDMFNRYVLDLQELNLSDVHALLVKRFHEEARPSGKAPLVPLAHEPKTVQIAGEQAAEVMRLLRDGSDLLQEVMDWPEILNAPLRLAIQAWQAQVLPFLAPERARGSRGK